MENTGIDLLITRIESLPDRDIISALATPDDYTLEAMAIYEAEAKRRGIQSEAVRPVAKAEAQRKRDKLASSRSIKGIGERLYGKRFFRADGSYQTTKWFVFFYLPIYPIGSFRVTHDGKGTISVTEVLPVDRRQVVDTYCFVAISWVSVAAGLRWIDQYSLPFGEVIGVVLMALPVTFLFVLRRRARLRTFNK